jgi:hypothetical protein
MMGSALQSGSEELHDNYIWISGICTTPHVNKKSWVERGAKQSYVLHVAVSKVSADAGGISRVTIVRRKSTAYATR